MMPGFIFRAIFLLVIFAGPKAFPQTATLTGKIRSNRDEPMVGATIVYTDNRGTVSDSLGNYSLLLPAGLDILVTFSFVGFDSLTQGVNLSPNEIRRLDVTLNERTTVLEQIEVISDPDIGDISRITIDRRSIEFLPSAFGDFSSILATLPGVVTASELSSGYSVRGGNYDENLVYIEGWEVYRPFLARAGRQEGLSAINTNLTSAATFYAGGWNATYGDKLSSVLDVDYKDPEEFGGSVSLGLLGGAAHIEGVSDNRRFSYLLGARNKRSRYLLNSLEVQGEYFPTFFDVQGLAKYKIGKTNPDRTVLGLFSTYARNRYQVIPETRESEFGTFNNSFRFLVAFEGQEILNYDTWQNGLSLDHKLTGATLLHSSLSVVKTIEREYAELEGGYRLCDIDKNPGSNTFNECVQIRGIGTNFFHSRNNLDGQFINGHFGLKTNSNSGLFEYGLTVNSHNFDDFLEEYSFIDSANFVNINSTTFNETETKALVYSGYYNHSLTIGKWSELNYGIRLSYRDLSDQFLFSPRIQYSTSPPSLNEITIKASAGIYQQHPLYREMRDFDGSLNSAVKAQQSLHMMLGIDQPFEMWSRPFKWTAEAYYKYLWDVIPYDVNNVRIRYYADNIATAFSTGFDARVSGEFIPGTESWFSLSLLNTRENVEGDNRGFIRRPTDQRLTLATVFEDHLPSNPSLKVNLGLVYGSGLPFGPPDDFENRNIFDAPAYNRVDLGFSKIIDFSNSGIVENLIIQIEVLNLFGSINVISYTWIEDFSGRSMAVPNTLSSRLLNIELSCNF